MTGADRLLAKPKCADFVVSALRGGFLDVNGVTSADQLGTYERGIYDNLSVASLGSALYDADFNDSGKPPAASEGGAAYTIFAHANFQATGTSSIDFYDPFFASGTTAQYETVIHEAMHLIWNIGDSNFAKAVGVLKPGMGGLGASQAWDGKLKENCK